MYTKDKTQRITLRLNERQFEFVRKHADVMGVSPSEFLRMVVNTTMCLSDGYDQVVMVDMEGVAEGCENDTSTCVSDGYDQVVMVDIADMEEVAEGRENDKANIDDKL